MIHSKCKVEMWDMGEKKCYFPFYRKDLTYFVCPKCGYCVPKNTPIRYYLSEM